MFDLAVNGLHHQVKTVVGEGFAGADETARQGTEIVPRAAGETASLFGQKPQVLLCRLEINLHAPTERICPQHLFGAQLRISSQKQSPVLLAAASFHGIQAAHEQQFHPLPSLWIARIGFKIQLYRKRHCSPRQIRCFAPFAAYRRGIQFVDVQQQFFPICLAHAIFQIPSFHA